MVDRALEGLDDAILAQQPNANSNSVAWLLWHMTRVVDTFVNSRLQSKPQLWVQDGWHSSQEDIVPQVLYPRHILSQARVGILEPSNIFVMEQLTHHPLVALASSS